MTQIPSEITYQATDNVQETVRVTALTDIGMRRRNNQDSLAVRLADGRVARERSGHLFIVADGMGAHAAGELASRLAVDLVQHHYEKHQQPYPVENLHRAFIEANNEIYRRGQANVEFRNMGTTCSALVLVPEGAICAHVGDSRIYRVRGSTLEQLTFDHSLVWEMQAAGGFDGEASDQIASIPKNVITRSLGPNASVVIDLEGPFEVIGGDRFLICSDGLSGQITDAEIGVFLQLLSIETAAQTMLDLANLRGGPDNISLIVVEVLGNHVGGHDASVEKLYRAPSVASGAATKYWIASAVGLLSAAILAMAGQATIAIVAGVIGCVSLIVGLAAKQIPREKPQFEEGKQYGRAPYRRYLCSVDAALVERLSGTIHALRDAAKENQWDEAIEVIDRMMPQAKQAEAARDFTTAVQRYASITIESMKKIRLARKS